MPSSSKYPLNLLNLDLYESHVLKIIPLMSNSNNDNNSHLSACCVTYRVNTYSSHVSPFYT